MVRGDLTTASGLAKGRGRVVLTDGGIVIEMGYRPQAVQKRFHQSPARYRFYGGAAGGGKTEALFQEAIAQILEAESKGHMLNGVIFRRSFPELERTHIRKFMEQIPSELGVYNGSRHVAEFRGGSRLEFGYCKDEGDISNYLSAEYDFIMIDELTQFTEYMWKMLMTRLRTSKRGVFPNFCGASNPGGVGHAWVKRLFIDKRFLTGEGFRPDEFEFIPASVYDNKFLCNVDPEYVRRLEALPEKQRAMYLDGNWGVFEGQFFTEWDPSKHTIDDFEIPKTWKRWIAGDYGYRAPSAVYWLAESPEGNIFVYRELYQAGLTASDLALKVLEMTPENEGISLVLFDPACWNRTYDKSIADVFMENGLFAVKANNNRIAGANLFRERLKVKKDGLGEHPTLQILKSCEHAIRTIPVLIHSKNQPEDVDSDGEDHAYDAIRYGIMGTTLKPEEETEYDVEIMIDPLTGYRIPDAYMSRN